MCSIAGVVSKKEIDINKMIDIQKHRAPDGSNFYYDKNIKMGMGRLKIIDLVSQGLCLYQENDLILSYNGEIFNYIELRTELKKLGIKFKTQSDTEVLLKSYQQWGIKALDKFNGMFAFAIYDKKKKKLILARDIAGEKPLYYYQKGDTFAFASEAKAFFGVLPLTQNKDINFFEAFQHCHITTLWNEVNEVPPANYLVYNVDNNKSIIKPYWELKPRDINLKTADEELESLLNDSVRIRTRSDVPYALYFSGGLDSSIISTFHDFDHKYFFNSKQEWKKDFMEKIKNIAWHLDFPVGSLSSFPLWKLAEEASKNVKVVLSGEGADEIFGGYVRYLPIAQEYAMRSKFPSYNSYLFKKYFKHSDYIDSFSAISARNKKYLGITRDNLAPYFKMFDDPINAMGFADFKMIMPSLLQMGDRMSSAFGLENRCPFLDKRIIEFGFSLPPEYKIRGLEQKFMLRKIAAKRGLVNALNMEKKGLIVVFNKWMKKEDWNRSYYFNFLKKNSISVQGKSKTK